MSVIEIGCCGAYCRTCKAYKSYCRGCKTGYDNGSRDIHKAKCRIKICCMKKGYHACADCSRFASCGIINGLYDKKGYKYGKYKEANLFIRKYGYELFLKTADAWKNAYGKIRYSPKN